MRNLTSGMQSGVTATVLRPALLVSMAFRSVTVYVWNGIGPLTFGGNTYLGLGELGSISPVEEGSTLEAKGLQLRLSGIPPTYTLPTGETIVSLLAEALGDIQLGNPVKVWIALFDETANIISSPYLAYAGRMDQPEIEAGPDSIPIVLNVENRMVDLQRAQQRRYTQLDQQLDYPSDTGMQWMSGLQDWNGSWGSD